MLRPQITMGLNEDAGLCAIRKDRRVFFNQCHLLVTDPFDPVLRKGVINQLLVVIVDALPRNAINKVVRDELREMVVARL